MRVNDLILAIYNKSIGESSLFGNPEYDKLSEEYNKILQELLSYIPEDKKNIYNKLENIMLQKEDMSIKDVYIRGFKDGAKIIMSIK